MRFLCAFLLLGVAGSAHAMRLGAKLQVNDGPPKIWVIEIKDDKSWESRTDGKLAFRFSVAPGKKEAIVHVEINEVGDKKTEQLAKMDVKAKWGKNAEVIEALNGYAVHLWLRPLRN